MATLPPTTRDFEKALDSILWWAEKNGLLSITVKSGNLHRLVGGCPSPKGSHRMPDCCKVMRKKMQGEDRIIQQPSKGDGATLVIEYQTEGRSQG